MKEIEKNIIKALEDEMTISEISQKLDMNRITVSKYLAVMEAKKNVKYREVGRAKLFSVRHGNE